MDFVKELLIAAVFLLLVYKWRVRSSRLPPGPWNLPLLGYLPWLDSKAPHKSLIALSKKFGPIYGLYLGSSYTVVLSEIKLMKKILLKDAASGAAPLYLNRKVFAPGNVGLIFSEGKLWKDQRKFVHNFFKTIGASTLAQNKEKLETKIRDQAMDFVEDVRKKGDKVSLDPTKYAYHRIGSVLSLVVLGKRWEQKDDTWKNFLQAYDQLPIVLGIAGPLNFLPFLRIFKQFETTEKTLKECVKIIHQTLEKVVKEKETSCCNEPDLIEAFLHEKNKRKSTPAVENFYNDEQIRYLLSDIFGAGLDTTVNSLLFYISYMAVHQKVQNKVRQEIFDTLQGKQPSYDDLLAMPYLEATMAELQRIETTIPLGVPQGALEDIEIENYIIPKGSVILSLIGAVHADPKVWGDPENFRPERFINEEGKFLKPESFIPFQTGKRICIGQELARMNLFLFIAIILKNFKMECEDPSMSLSGTYGFTTKFNPKELIFTRL